MDILITATSAASPVLSETDVRCVMGRRRHRPLFIIDIAVPRNVDCAVNGIDDVYLYNVDDLKGVADGNLKLRRKQMQEAEALTTQAVEAFSGWMEQLEARPTIQQFESFVDEILERELSQVLAENGVDAEKRAIIRQRIRSRLMHAPIEKIKEASRNGGVKRYLEALRSLFNLDPRETSQKETRTQDSQNLQV